MVDFNFPLKESLEFAVTVGCPHNCVKYCPQEIVLSKYDGVKSLKLDTFKALLSSVPAEVGVIFAGVSEPFMNEEIVEMVLHAHKKSHEITFFSTLKGATPEKIFAFKDVPFANFCVHLPDTVNLRFPFNNVWAESLHAVCTLIPSASFMSMNEWFTSTNGREKLSRGIRGKCKRFGNCQKFNTPQMMVYPNGSVYVCCTDFGLEHKVGNLFSESYSFIKEFMLNNKPYELCHYCRFYLNLPRRSITRIARLCRRNILRQKRLPL
jgi:hypothetical protein